MRDLCRWFDTARRDLPWRATDPDGRRDPYLSLVSEIMLQQTQVSRVVEKFTPFIDRFPTVQVLAEADTDDVLSAWSGLGYYRRARSLHAAAQQIVERFGDVPESVDDLLSLSGIGRYTAGAISSIVFGHSAPIVDGNVTRVLLRLDGRDLDPKDSKTADGCWRRAEQLMHSAARSRATGVSVGVFNEAMMELGALVCTPASPACLHCPLREDCRAAADGRQDEIPRPKKAARKKTVHASCILIEDDAGRLLIEQRPSSGLWAGLWQPPTLESDSEIRKSLLAKHFGLASSDLSRQDSFLFETTHRSVRFVVYRSRAIPADAAEREWVARNEIENRALGTPQRRMLLGRVLLEGRED